jgi:hypothetical protein
MAKSLTKHLHNDFVIYILLFVGWAVVNLYFYNTLGAVHAVDTPRYHMSAKEIIDTGRVNFSYNYWSSGYIFFIYLCLLLELTDKGIVLIQIIISGFGMLTCIKSSEIIYNKNAGVVAGLIYLAHFKNQLCKKISFIFSNIHLRQLTKTRRLFNSLINFSLLFNNPI